VDPEKMKKRTCARWTLEEDIRLLEFVINSQLRVNSVADIEDMQVDWDACAESGLFAERSSKVIREHWQRNLFKDLIMEDDVREMLQFRRMFLEKILAQGARHRSEIEWDDLADKFKPKTKPVLQRIFTDLTRGGIFGLNKIVNSEEFLERLPKAIEKIERDLLREDHTLERKYKFVKQQDKKNERLFVAQKLIRQKKRKESDDQG